MPAPILNAEGLVKRYGGVHAVDGVSLSVAPGELLALIGPNGAGKSTLFNLISGQTLPDAGAVRLGDTVITGLPPHRLARKGLGRSFQITGSFASLTVREAIQAARIARLGRSLRAFGFASRVARQDVDHLIHLVGLDALADRVSATLSYGDLKRVELAIALAGEPRVLLMDEPTAGMALAERKALMALVSALARQASIGILFTEHDMDIVFGHADRVLVMARGALIAAGSPAEVRANPAVRAVYLGGSLGADHVASA